MTQEEKFALLKEAGVWDVIGFPTCIDKLFELVAANEREACAQVCERLISGDGLCADDGVWIHDCAAAIRNRGAK